MKPKVLALLAITLVAAASPAMITLASGVSQAAAHANHTPGTAQCTSPIQPRFQVKHQPTPETHLLTGHLTVPQRSPHTNRQKTIFHGSTALFSTFFLLDPRCK